MATLVLEQDESVRMIETQAVQVNSDVENGYVSAFRIRSPALSTDSHAKLQSAADEEGRQERTAGSAYAMGLLHHPALASLLSALGSGEGPLNVILTE